MTRQTPAVVTVGDILEGRLPFRRGKYGTILTIDQGSWEYAKGKRWKKPEKRLDRYEMGYEYYLEHQFARPVTNLTASAVFGKGVHLVGENDHVDFARPIIDQLDHFMVGIESSIYGDNFIRIFDAPPDSGRPVDVALIPPVTIADKITADGNAMEPTAYVQKFSNEQKGESIPASDMVHAMVNAVSNSLFGNSDHLHLFYWYDLYDSMTEEADKRRLFASQPIGKFTGVNMRYRTQLKTRINKVARDKDQKTGLRRSLPPGTQLILPPGADYVFAEPRGAFDLESMLNRIALIIAMAAEVPIHWLNLGKDVNRATSTNMTFPFIKKIQRRQEIFSRKYEELLRKSFARLKAQREKGEKFRRLPSARILAADELDVRVEFPPIFDYELEDVERALKSVTLLYQQGLVSHKTAVDTVCKYLGLDVEEEERLLDEEREKAETAEQEYSPVDRLVQEIGSMVSDGDIDRDTANRMIEKLTKA